MKVHCDVLIFRYLHIIAFFNCNLGTFFRDGISGNSVNNCLETSSLLKKAKQLFPNTYNIT